MIEARLKGILKLSADTREQLRPSDVDRVMSEAHDQGLDVQFKQWLLSVVAFHNPRTREIIEAWTPEK